MRRITLALLTGLLVAGITLPGVTNVSAVSHSSTPLAKKVRKTKTVHGKKKKVCTTVKRKATPTPTPTPTLSLAEQVDNLLISKGFSGSILLEKSGQMLLEKSYGMADKTSNALNSRAPRFPSSASIST